MGTAIKQSCLCQTGLSSHLYFWHLCTLTLSPEWQSAQMSKITNGGLTQCDTGWFIAVPIMATVGVKGLNVWVSFFFFCESSQERSKLFCVQGEDIEPIVHIHSNRTVIISSLTSAHQACIEFYVYVRHCRTSQKITLTFRMSKKSQCHHLGQQCQQHNDREWVSRV